MAVELGYLRSDVDVRILGGCRVIIANTMQGRQHDVEGLQGVVDELGRIRGDDARTVA